MFDYVVASIQQPPDDHPYDKPKEQLIKRTTASEQQRLQQLLSSAELGDLKPFDTCSN